MHGEKSEGTGKVLMCEWGKSIWMYIEPGAALPAPGTACPSAPETSLCSVRSGTLQNGETGAEGVCFLGEVHFCLTRSALPLAYTPPVNFIHLLSVNPLARAVKRNKSQPSASDRIMRHYLLWQEFARAFKRAIPAIVSEGLNRPKLIILGNWNCQWVY